MLINKCYKNYSVQNCWSPLTVTIGARDQDRTNFACGMVGDQRKEVIHRRPKRSWKRREGRKEGQGESVMCGTASDGEGSVGHEADFVDATADTEVDMRLHLEVDWRPDSPRDHVGTVSGAVD